MPTLDPTILQHRTDKHIDVEEIIDRALAITELLLSNAEDDYNGKSFIPAHGVVYNSINAISGTLLHAKSVIRKDEDAENNLFATLYCLKGLGGAIGDRAKAIDKEIDIARESKKEIQQLAEKAGLAIKTA